MLDLTGFWGGTYSYPFGEAASVPFDAELHDEGGTLMGQLTEPNTFSRDPSPVLGAFLRGSVRGNLVTFDKTYDGGGAAHAVAYEGVLNEEGTVVVGRWRIRDFGGPFLKRRDPGWLMGMRKVARAEQ